MGKCLSYDAKHDFFSMTEKRILIGFEVILEYLLQLSVRLKFKYVVIVALPMEKKTQLFLFKYSVTK